MKHKRTLFVLAAMVMVLGASFARAEVLPPGGGSGAIFTTTPDGSIVNENVHYTGRQYVYLDGGPKQNAPADAAGLEEGFYVFQITDPAGKLLLSRDPSRCRIVHVNAEGVIDQLMAPTDNSTTDPDGNTVYDYTGAGTDNWQDSGKYANEPCHVAGPDPDSAPGSYAPTPDITGMGRHDTNPDIDHNDVGAIVVQMMPYGLTPNPGGVYKAWMTPIQAYTSVKNADLDDVPNKLPNRCDDFCASADPGFVPSHRYTKTDNFKVTEKFPTEIRVQKFEDLNSDGIWQKDTEPELGVGMCVNEAGDFIDCPGGWPYDFTEPLDGGTKTDTFYTPYVHVAGFPGTYTAEEYHLPGWMQTAAYLDSVFVYDNGNPAKAVSVDVQEITPGVVHVIIFGNYKLPEIEVTKTATPTLVIEPGGDVTFTFKVENTGTVPVTITNLSDSVFGVLAGDADCMVGTFLAVGASCEFSLTEFISGDASTPDHVNVFTAKAKDEHGNEVEDDDDAIVEIKGIHKIFLPLVFNPSQLPTIMVTKTADPTLVYDPGGNVTFTFVVENTGPVAVTITSLSDSVFGTLAGDADCKVGTILAVGASCEFSITEFIPVLLPETRHVNVFTAKAVDDQMNEATDDDDATVDFLGPVCPERLAKFSITIGYEDLKITEPIDYDYNDWIFDMAGTLDLVPDTCDLQKLDLTIIPQARGAAYDHKFHLVFPANTFPSDGTATVTIKDQNGNPTSRPPERILASEAITITIFEKTSDVFDPLTNTDQKKTKFVPPRMTAELSIVFDTPGLFDLNFEDLISPRGEGLFFDPHLDVINNGETVHRGDFRLLVVPVAEYLWPEETVPIYNVYDGVDFISAGNLNFQLEWWLSPHNDCVYDDKPCPLLP